MNAAGKAPASLHMMARLARRLARSHGLAKSTSVVFIAVVFVMAMFVVLASMSLSGDQVVARDLGRFGATVGYGSIQLPPGEDGFVPALYEQAGNAGATGAMVKLSATDVQLATAPFDNITLLEMAWQSRPYPDRYMLLSGRWPTRHGRFKIMSA